MTTTTTTMNKTAGRRDTAYEEYNMYCKDFRVDSNNTKSWCTVLVLTVCTVRLLMWLACCCWCGWHGWLVVVVDVARLLSLSDDTWDSKTHCKKQKLFKYGIPVRQKDDNYHHYHHDKTAGRRDTAYEEYNMYRKYYRVEKTVLYKMYVLSGSLVVADVDGVAGLSLLLMWLACCHW